MNDALTRLMTTTTTFLFDRSKGRRMMEIICLVISGLFCAVGIYSRYGLSQERGAYSETRDAFIISALWAIAAGVYA